MPVFGRNNCRDVLNALHQKADAFKDDPLNQELAISCAIDAWSLCDWVFKEHGQRLGFKKLGAFQSSMKAMCTSMELLQDIANISKHKVITYEPQLKEGKKHQGVLDRNVFSVAFDVPALILVRKDDSEVWFDDALLEVVQYWDDYFLKKGLP